MKVAMLAPPWIPVPPPGCGPSSWSSLIRPSTCCMTTAASTAFAFADRISTPVVHTLHGPFRPDMSAFYARHGHKAVAVALSRYQAEQAPAEPRGAAVIGNPIVVDDFPFRH